MNKEDFYINFIIFDQNKGVNNDQIDRIVKEKIKKKDIYWIYLKNGERKDLNWQNDDDSWSIKLYELLKEYINSNNKVKSFKVDNQIMKDSSGYYLIELEHNMKLSSDLVSTSKSYLNYDEDIKDDFIYDRTLAGKIVWPKIHFGVNNSKGASYKGIFDRIDLTLYLIKIYYNVLKMDRSNQIEDKLIRHNNFLNICKNKNLLEFEFKNCSFNAYQSLSKLFVAYDDAKQYFELFADENGKPSFNKFSTFWGLVSENDNNFIKYENGECYIKNLKTNSYDEKNWFWSKDLDFCLIPNKDYFKENKYEITQEYSKNMHIAIKERRKEMMKNVGL